MKKNTQLSIAVWLMEEKPDRVLGNTIDDLATRLNAPHFLPHIIMSFVQIPEEQLSKVKRKLEIIASSLTPITLSISGVSYVDNLFKSMFLEFEESAGLNILYKKIQADLEKFGNYSFNPHLSLVYKEMPADEKKKIIPTIQLPKHITFSKLGLNILTDNSQLLDVENWNIESFRSS